MAKVLNYGFEVSEFEHQSRYYIHFWTNIQEKSMNLQILLAMGKLVSLLF